MNSLIDFSEIPRFDLAEALRRCMGKKGFVQELSTVLVQESLPMYLPNLKKGVMNKDLDMIARNSHAIKGGCAAIGLIRARDMAYAMETASKAGDMSRVEEVMPEFMAEIDEVVDSIKSGTLT